MCYSLLNLSEMWSFYFKFIYIESVNHSKILGNNKELILFQCFIFFANSNVNYFVLSTSFSHLKKVKVDSRTDLKKIKAVNMKRVGCNLLWQKKLTVVSFRGDTNWLSWWLEYSRSFQQIKNISIPIYFPAHKVGL